MNRSNPEKSSQPSKLFRLVVDLLPSVIFVGIVIVVVGFPAKLLMG